MIWSDDYTKIPAPPRYVVEKPVGTAPFSVLSEGGLRVRYRANPDMPRAEFTPRTDPDNKVGIRLPKRIWHTVEMGIRVQSGVQKGKAVVMQFYQTQKANPPLSLEVNLDYFRLVRLHFPTAWPGYNPNREIVWEGFCSRRIWHEFRIGVLFDETPGGKGEIVIEHNGDQERIVGPNCYGDDVGFQPKAGIYRPGAVDRTVPFGQETIVDFRKHRIWVPE